MLLELVEKVLYEELNFKLNDIKVPEIKKFVKKYVNKFTNETEKKLFIARGVILAMLIQGLKGGNCGASPKIEFKERENNLIIKVIRRDGQKQVQVIFSVKEDYDMETYLSSYTIYTDNFETGDMMTYSYDELENKFDFFARPRNVLNFLENELDRFCNDK